MPAQKQDAKRLFIKKGRQIGLGIVILSALLLEAIAAIQYYHTRSILERNLEQQVLIMLRVSAMRMDGTLNATVDQILNQTWHAQKNTDNPEYIETMLKNLVKSENNRVVGATVAFSPNYFPEKGRWYEPYAHGHGDEVIVEQIGSANHDYLQLEFYQTGIKGDTLKWGNPYKDDAGAKSEVTTYALPIRNASGKPVAVLGVDITTDWISEIVNQVKLHPSSFNLVLSSTGGLISAPPDSVCSPELAKKIAAMVIDPAVKKEERANDRVTYFPFTNQQTGRKGRVYFANKKYEPKWLMVKVVYEDEAFGELYKLQRHIIWMTILGILVLVLIIQLFARNARKLQSSLMQQQRTDQELQIANGIQQALLPLDDPSLHGVDEVEVAGHLLPAREVGGDLFNFFVRDGKLLFCIGDVSGKGVPAALIMAVTQTLFHNIASEENNPSHIMERMNATACRNNESNIFVTLFIGVLDLKTGQLDYCNAGHEPPLLNGKPLNVVANIPIGLFDGFSYEMQETTIPTGETLFLYTDGLTESRNAQDQLFGRERTQQLINRCNSLSPKEMINAVVNEVKQYSENTVQSDDLTLLAIRYKPKKQQ